MRFESKKVLTHAVVASTLLISSQASLALDITTDLSTTQVLVGDKTLNISPGTSDGGTLDVVGCF